MIIASARVLRSPLTGVQRYTAELLSRLPEILRVTPPGWVKPPFGAFWEQTALPIQVGRNLLWSPAGAGPVAVSRQIVTVHDLAPIDVPGDYTPAYRTFYRWLFPRLLPRVASIITVSEFSRRRVIEEYRVPGDRVHAILNGVDHATFYPRPAGEIEEIRGRLGLPPRYVLYLGTISVRKNVGQLVEAWRAIQADVDPDVHLVIAGGAGVSRVFHSAVLPDLPARTRLLGRVEAADLPKLLAGADVFVFPSLYEGFGLPPIEAMACGTPAIVSNRSSLPEVVGDAALVFDPADPSDLAAKLKRLLNSPAERLRFSERGLRRAAEFTWDKAAKRTWDVLSAH